MPEQTNRKTLKQIPFYHSFFFPFHLSFKLGNPHFTLKICIQKQRRGKKKRRTQWKSRSNYIVTKWVVVVVMNQWVLSGILQWWINDEISVGEDGFLLVQWMNDNRWYWYWEWTRRWVFPGWVFSGFFYECRWICCWWWWTSGIIE